MTATLPLDILNRVERRWSARMKQAGSFPAEADRLKRTGATFIEGAQPQRGQPSPIGEGEAMPLAPSLPADEE